MAQLFALIQDNHNAVMDRLDGIDRHLDSIDAYVRNTAAGHII